MRAFLALAALPYGIVALVNAIDANVSDAVACAAIALVLALPRAL